MNKSMSFVATGDSFITRRLPSATDKNFCNISKIIHEGEFRFTNFEVTAHHFEGFPSAVSGGTWAIAPPTVLDDIKAYGFNTLAWANNHTLDYSYGGLEATAKYMNAKGFIHAGVGRNLAEASAPKYVDCPSGRVAIIAATSTFHETWAAGEQRADVEGRPGVNPLRHDTKYVVAKEKLAYLKEIAAVTDINADHNLAVKEGFAVATNPHSFKFGNYDFEAGDKEGKITTPAAIDLLRIKKAISEAKRQADYVIVSIHSHEMEGEDKSKPAPFIKNFSRACIDEGAHAIIGHGPHILRGIEIYKHCPIFYSLGNFIFQNDTVSNLPHDFYTKYGMGFEENVADAIDKRSDNGKKGLGVNRDVWESVIPSWTMKNGRLEKITLYPIELGFETPRYTRGWPKLATSSQALEKLKILSEPFNTKIEIKNSIGFIYG
ncbi:CapA family protein [Virgibacillus sp. W0430]|uniref:CapA family protein n=1 Tax=Virgibacillus sp. W0430 TaxID=3391580 RepID=UPI003F476731